MHKIVEQGNARTLMKLRLPSRIIIVRLRLEIYILCRPIAVHAIDGRRRAFLKVHFINGCAVIKLYLIEGLLQKLNFVQECAIITVHLVKGCAVTTIHFIEMLLIPFVIR